MRGTLARVVVFGVYGILLIWSDRLPTETQNRQIWSAYAWPEKGDEWSVHFGGTSAMWLRIVLPRISAFLPARRILEIGPGFGRWSQYLVNGCEELFLVDVSQKCIDACSERFREDSQVKCFLNDGNDLSMLADQSLDFVFSFDSLVHAEDKCIEAYVSELARTLDRDGVGWIHHSNLAQSATEGELQVDDPHGRSATMSAVRFVEFCHAAGLVCFAQEVIDWGGALASDCISLVARPGSQWGERSYQKKDSANFMADAAVTRELAEFYYLV